MAHVHIHMGAPPIAQHEEQRPMDPKPVVPHRQQEWERIRGFASMKASENHQPFKNCKMNNPSPTFTRTD